MECGDGESPLTPKLFQIVAPGASAAFELDVTNLASIRSAGRRASDMTITIDSIQQDEPVDLIGDGSTCVDS